MCEWETGLADRILGENELETIPFWSECSEMLLMHCFNIRSLHSTMHTY